MGNFDPFDSEGESSTFFIDIFIDMPKIEKALNNKLPTALFKSNIKGVDVTAEKAGNFSLKITASTIEFKVPLNLKISKNVGLGNVEVDGEIEMDFRTQYTVTPQWKLSTQTDLLGHHWIKMPVLKAGFIKLPIENVADMAIDQMHEKMIQTIDEQIGQQIDLRQLVSSIWEQMSKPIEASNDFNTWVSLRPSGVSLLPLESPNPNLIQTQLQVILRI